MDIKPIIKYFRIHRWQRRVVVLLSVVTLAAGTGRLLAPFYMNWKIIRELGSENRETRLAAAGRCVARIQGDRPELLDVLANELNTENETCFLSIVKILKYLDKFGPEHIDGKWLDRNRFIELRNSAIESNSSKLQADCESISAHCKRIINDLTLSESDNEYVKKAAAAASRHPCREVKMAAAMLAAKTGLVEVISKLVDDPDPNVSSMAAVDAGLARMGQLENKLASLMENSMERLGGSEKSTNDPAPVEKISSSIYALAKINPRKASPIACKAVLSTNNPELLERLMITLQDIGDDRCRNAVSKMLLEHKATGDMPPAMVIKTGTVLDVDKTRHAAKAVLKKAAEGGYDLTRAQLIAAMDAAIHFKIPCRRELCRIYELHWLPNRPVMLIYTAKLLAAQSKFDNRQSPDDPGAEKCLKLLKDAVTYSILLDDNTGRYNTTPLGSAAAAVELWKMNPVESDPETFTLHLDKNPASDDFNPVTALRTVLAERIEESTDYIAWETGNSGIPGINGLGQWFFPEFNSGHIEHNPETRFAGAMMLSLSAATYRERKKVFDRIERACRMKRYIDQEFFSLRCAQLSTGNTEHAERIRLLFWEKDLAGNPVLSFRRVATGLLLAGDRQFLDEILLNENMPDEDIRHLITGEILKPVFESTVGLPAPGFCAGIKTQLWTVRIMRHEYGINRKDIKIGRN